MIFLLLLLLPNNYLLFQVFYEPILNIDFLYKFPLISMNDNFSVGQQQLQNIQCRISQMKTINSKPRTIFTKYKPDTSLDDEMRDLVKIVARPFYINNNTYNYDRTMSSIIKNTVDNTIESKNEGKTETFINQKKIFKHNYHHFKLNRIFSMKFNTRNGFKKSSAIELNTLVNSINNMNDYGDYDDGNDHNQPILLTYRTLDNV